VLSAILQKATGMSAREFANENLFGPIGIGLISEVRWPSDPQKITIGGYGLALTPEEMAKLGFLFLNQGQWDGKTIVPADWVAASTVSHANKGDKKEYGYLWWIDPQGKWYAALGRSGQHIFVYPAENLVVVFTADLPFTHDADLVPLQELLDQYILPAVKSDKPLPANPNSVARLTAGTQALARPQRMTPQPLPAIAARISGKTYQLENNPFWKTVAFSFTDGADAVQVTLDGAQMMVGLDNVYRIVNDPESTFSQGVRGRWENQDTFMVDNITLGQTGASTVRVRFSEDTIYITVQYSGDQVEIQSALTPAAK
jgi:hypothetical protein